MQNESSCLSTQFKRLCSLFTHTHTYILTHILHIIFRFDCLLSHYFSTLSCSFSHCVHSSNCIYLFIFVVVVVVMVVAVVCCLFLGVCVCFLWGFFTFSDLWLIYDVKLKSWKMIGIEFVRNKLCIPFNKYYVEATTSSENKQQQFIYYYLKD